jgi:hypothetical protein
MEKGDATMASVIIELPPELERRLQEEAEKRGQKVGDYARMVLEAGLGARPKETGESIWKGLPRRAPEELDALARSQGAPLAVRTEDLIGDFWPEDESCDEFIATVRRWRREGSRARRTSDA